MSAETVLPILRRLITECHLVSDVDFDLRPATRLIEDLGLDSVGMIELLTAVEEEFDITINLDEIEVETLNRAGSFAALIAGKVAPVG